MLNKLLKYDFKALFKYLWIGFVVSFGMCAAGGVCITILRSERDIPTIVNVTAIIMIVFAAISLAALALLCTVLIFVRVYKNFFTDEGYLTFTLPVKRTQLLNSKVMTGTLAYIVSIIVSVFNLGVMLSIGFGDEIFRKEVWQAIKIVINEIIDEIGWYALVYLLELIVIGILAILFFILFLYVCITFASVITKKARVIAAVGIYYFSNMIFSFIIQIFMFFGISGIGQRLGSLKEAVLEPAVGLVLLAIVLFVTLACALLYTLEYWLLDRKLNLA